MTTTLTKAWELKGFRVNPQTNRVAIAEWTLEFTDETNYPGVKSTAAGITPVDLDADTATHADILAAVELFMSSQMQELEWHHTQHMDFEYLKAQASQEVVLVEPEVTMRPLSPRQIRLALDSIGITEAMVEAELDGDNHGLIEWRHATQYEREHPLVVALGVAFELPSEQIDDLWIWAQEL